MSSKATKVAKSTPPPSKTASQGQSPSRDYIATSSIAKRTRTQLAASAGQRAAAKTDSSSKADEAPYSPGVKKEEESDDSSFEGENPIR